MGVGKQINLIGKSNLNLNSVTDMITDLAHRLETNIKLVDYEDDSEKLFDFKYLNTHELIQEKYFENKKITGYSYSFINSFFELNIFPSGFFQINVDYNSAWSLFIEDLQINFSYYKNKDEFITLRKEALQFCNLLGSNEVLVLSDFDYKVIDDLIFDNCKKFKHESLNDLATKFVEVDKVTLFPLNKLIALNNPVDFGNTPISEIVFTDSLFN